MEKLFYQSLWQNIRLDQLSSASHGLAGRALYGDFYRALLESPSALPNEWVAQKRRVGRWLAESALSGAPARRVLSVGSGLGITEQFLRECGHRVHVLEVELEPFRYALEQETPLTAIVGDARDLPLRDGVYDLVYMVGVDYCFPRVTYARVLSELGRVTARGGVIVTVCFSNLSLLTYAKSLAREAGRQLRGRRDQAGVPWGYQRTINEHLAAGRRSGLRCRRVDLFDRSFEHVGGRIGSAFRTRLPTLTDCAVAVTFGPDPLHA